MEEQKYVYVTEAIASAILERTRVFPIYLHTNPDNSITAVFDDEPTEQKRQNIEDADETIILLEPGHFGDYQADAAPTLSVRFAFTAHPNIYR